ncbi:hypothetical protein [Haloarcula halophila]|uniref:hypothetical protein n=1 Tax=Haloarcula TaxID=2237 RepID=UPI0023E38FA8|nr:hypothetical protein [Halomicroarcula sp. DFY41]
MNDRTVADAHGFVYQPVRGPKRRVEFEPRSDGRFERVESMWNGCRWKETGREALANVRRI